MVKKSLSHVLQNLNVRESWPFAYFERCIIRFSLGFRFAIKRFLLNSFVLYHVYWKKNLQTFIFC